MVKPQAPGSRRSRSVSRKRAAQRATVSTSPASPAEPPRTAPTRDSATVSATVGLPASAHTLALVGSRRAPASLRRVQFWLLKCLIALIDALLILVGFALAYWMRYIAVWPRPLNQVVREVAAPNFVSALAFRPYLLPLVFFLMVIYVVKGLYRPPRTANILDQAGIIISGTITGIAVLIVYIFIIFPPSMFYSRLLFGLIGVNVIVLLCVWHGLILAVQRWRWARGVGRKRVLVVGGTGLGRELMESIVAQPFIGYALVGYLDDRPPPVTERADGHFRHLGSVNDLPSLARLLQVDQVMLALPFWEQSRLPELVETCRAAGVEFRVAPDLYQLNFDKVDVANLGGVPLIAFKEVSLKGVNLVIKRAMDFALILVAAPLVLPLVGLIALLVRRDSSGPIVFQQQRVGKNGVLFTAYKFRTMVADAEQRKTELATQNEADGPIFKMRDDPRITRIGRILRRTSLDELPQLWNIVRGEMSLVGPRPPTPDEVSRYDRWHRRRLEVTPGLTGLWQVLGRSDTSFEEMVRLDIYYAENWSPTMDVRILLLTIPAVLSGKGAY